MEEDRGEWEIVEEEEGESGGGGDGGKMRLILNKGWGVGKKIMITGVVISSAPIVLPPLVVFSTLGFAFAVPFGVYFASYACTNKIMSKLFSSPSSEEEDEESEESMGGEEGEVGYVDKEKESIGEGNVANEANAEETREIEEVEKPAAARESKDESKKEENVAVEEVEERKSEGGIGNAQENEPLEKENGVVRIEEEEKKPVPEKSENGGITGDHSNVDDKKAKTEEITSDNASDAREEGHSTVDNASDASSQGSTGPAAGRGLAGSKSGKRNRKSKTAAAAVSSKEAYSEEKKIWEQIDALRKILGYKIAPQVNSMEEVKALYVFTGVEPPSAFKGPSDLADVAGKLHLLMSIVGVK